MQSCIIVIPCYNEAARLDVGAFLKFARQDCPCNFLFVNDGSTDHTLDLLESLQASHPERFWVHNLPENRGKAEAVRLGIRDALAADPDMVGFWDADLATPLETIVDFLRVLEQDINLHMVIGARVRLLGRHIERRPMRHYLGRLFATAASAVLQLPIYDTQCGAKLFRTSPEVRTLFSEPFRSNWVFDVELLARFQQVLKQPATAAIYELPLLAWRDVAGSKVKPRDFVKAALELLDIYFAYRRFAASGHPAPSLKTETVEK